MSTNSASAARATHLDTLAARAVRGFMAGEIDELAVRWELAALIRESRIAEMEAWGYLGRRAQDVADLTTDLVHLLYKKVVGEQGVPPMLDLTLIANGASLAGWTRNFLRTAVPREHNKGLRNRPRLLSSTVVEETVQGVARLDGSQLGRDRFDPDRDDVDGYPVDEEAGVDAAAMRYSRTARNLRHAARVHFQARAIQEVYSMPAPRRLVYRSDREKVVARLNVDKAVAARAAAHPGSEPAFEPAFAALDAEIRARLSHADPRVSHTYVLAAFTPTAPPQEKAVVALVAEVTKTLGDRRKASRLVKRWAASVTELSGSEYTPAAQPTLKSFDTLTADLDAWNREAATLVAAGVTALGADPGEIGRELATRLGAVELQFFAA